jgi:DNA-binding PadR family transcriptional regulator
MSIRKNNRDISVAPFKPRPLSRRPRLARGDLHAGILSLLGQRPHNGYQIIHELERRSGGLWQPSPGSVYPALRELEESGLLRREETGGTRSLHLTERGRTHLETRRDQVAALWAALGAMATPELLESGRLLRELEVASSHVARTGSNKQIRAAEAILREARRALYAILAQQDEEDEEDQEQPPRRGVR